MKENEMHLESNMKEETINMRELGKIVFPDIDEITSERKASSTFKRACKQLGIDPKDFKPRKEYSIPAGGLAMWTLLLRNINAVEGNPSKNGYMNFVEDVIHAKGEVDEQMHDLKNSEADLPAFQQSMATVYEMFYTSSVHGQSIAMLLHNELLQIIQKDIKYILEKAPADRTVMYTEMYFKEINQKAEKMGAFIRKMVKEKWNEQ
jgi:hypothetical protein